MEAYSGRAERVTVQEALAFAAGFQTLGGSPVTTREMVVVNLGGDPFGSGTVVREFLQVRVGLPPAGVQISVRD